MWQVQFARANDFLIIARLCDDSLDELEKYFDNVTSTFDNLHSSVFCTSVIYVIRQFNPTEENIAINYHIDSEEKIIRVTSVDVN